MESHRFPKGSCKRTCIVCRKSFQTVVKGNGVEVEEKTSNSAMNEIRGNTPDVATVAWGLLVMLMGPAKQLDAVARAMWSLLGV